MGYALKLIIVLLVSGGIAGCSFIWDIPKQFRIDRGIDPKYLDEDVRFRTTYYFRVFDVCDEEDKDGTAKPLNDSLYRFRMTGKANAYFDKVHFESGTLRAEQIDPFGTTVRYDETTKAFKIVAARQSRDESTLDAKIKEIEKLLKIRSVLNESIPTKEQVKELNHILDESVRELSDHQHTTSPRNKDRPSLSTEPKSESSGQEFLPSETRCANNKQARRGFQILGPEGFRTFDQDERLLMAFSYDTKPLISLLQEVSSRTLSVRGGSQSFQDLSAERVRIRNALRQLDNIQLELETKDPSSAEVSAEEIVKRIMKRFDDSAEHKLPGHDIRMPPSTTTQAPK